MVSADCEPTSASRIRRSSEFIVELRRVEHLAKSQYRREHRRPPKLKDIGQSARAKWSWSAPTAVCVSLEFLIRRPRHRYRRGARPAAVSGQMIRLIVSIAASVSALVPRPEAHARARLQLWRHALGRSSQVHIAQVTLAPDIEGAIARHWVAQRSRRFRFWHQYFVLDRARPRWRTGQPKRTAVVSRLTNRRPVNETGAVQRP